MTNQKNLVYSLILGVVTVDSLAAVAIAIGQRPPLELGIGLLFGGAVGGFLLILVTKPRVFLWWARPAQLKQTFNRPFRIMMLSRFDWPLFALAADLIGTTATAIIWGIKPTLTIVFLRQFVHEKDGQRRYQPLTKQAWLWLALAFGGLVLVVLGRPGQSGPTGSWLLTIVGAITALASVTCAGLATIRFEWGRLLADQFPARPTQQRPEIQLVILGISLAMAAVGVSLVGIYRLSGHWPAWDNFWPGALIGLLLTTSGFGLATVAWLRTRRLEVGGLFYLTPILTVALLALIGRLGDINPVLVLSGGGLIIGASLALVRADQQQRSRPAGD